MQIEIRKYKYVDDLKNYFELPTFVDKIVVNQTMGDGFPIFNQEYNEQFDVFSLVASDYDMKFSLLQTEVSNSGKNIEKFCTVDIDNHVLVCKVKLDDKVFGGIVDINSIKLNYTIHQNRYDIKFTMYDFVKEISSYADKKPPRVPTLSNPTRFNSYIQSFHFRRSTNELQAPYFQIDTTKLNWDRTGNSMSVAEPCLITEIWQKMFDTGRLNETTAWKLFEDICKGWGIMFKVEMGNDYNNYFTIKMTLFFRDKQLLPDITIDMMTHEEGFKTDVNSNILQFLIYQKGARFEDGEVGENGGEGFVGTRLYGMLIDKNRYALYDGRQYQLPGFGHGFECVMEGEDGYGTNKYDPINGNPFPFGFGPKSVVNKIEMNYYFNMLFENTSGGHDWIILGENENDAFNTFITSNGSNFRQVSFPRLWTTYAYTDTALFFLNSRYVHFYGTPNTRTDIHGWLEYITQNITQKCYKFLVSSLAKTLNAKLSLIKSFNINLFNTVIVNNIRYLCKSLKNLDLNKREVDSEWIELESTKKEN